MPRTLADDLVSDATAVFLNTNDFARTVSRLPGGEGSGVSVVAIIDDMGDGGLEMETASGVMVQRTMRLEVAESQAVTYDDQWVIDGERWETIGCPPGRDGIRVVTVRRTDQMKQRRTAR